MRSLIVHAAADGLLRAELERHGHEVVAASRDEAAGLARGATLAAVGLDAGPEEALAACRVLRAAAPDLVIVVVGPEDRVDVPAALAAGASDVWALRPDEGGELRVRLALAEHLARLQAEHVRLGGEFALMRRALDQTGTGFVLTDPGLEDNPIVYANEAFYDLTGYTAEDTLGHNCRFLQGEATEPERVRQLRDAIAEQRPVSVELTNHRKDGTAFRNEVHVAPVRDDRGRVVRFVGVQHDVTAYRRQERLYAVEQEARVAAEAAERRSAFLADVSPLLDASLDLRATLDRLARLTVRDLADLCLVDVLEAGEVRRVASAAREPSVERLLRGLPGSYAVRPGRDDPVARVLRGRRSEIVRSEAAGVFGGWAGALGEHAPRAAMLVPLIARGRAVGVLAMATSDPQRSFHEDDLALAEDLARRAALALDNARLFEQQRGVAQVLQDSLLPERLPEVEGLELGAAFRPAGDGTQIGGDFYDAFPAGDGALALAIGDVSGKGAKAAALTGLSRHTLRTAAMYEHGPSDMLAALNRALLAQRTVRGKYCTAALCRLAPSEAGDGAVRLTVACAGHPLPLVLRRDGTVEALGRSGTLLGYVEDPRLHDEPAELLPGDALVLYTDGITEARTRDGLLGDERLAALLRTCAGLPAGAIASRLEHATVQAHVGPPRDDVAIAVARVPA